MTKYTALLAALMLGACSHTQKIPQRETANSLIETQLELALEKINFNELDLHPWENWKGGDREIELTEFRGHIKEILSAQAKLAKESNGGLRGRVFHQKEQGCVTGTLVIYKTRKGDPEKRTFSGLFSGKVSRYPVLVRFSNGVGKDQADILPDVRGAAIKIFGVKDQATGEVRDIDFLMTNSPTPFGVDQAQFIEFMNANLKGQVSALSYALSHPELKIIPRTFRVVSSLAKETFWSGHAYKLGDKEVMKFNIQPFNAVVPNTEDYGAYEVAEQTLKYGYDWLTPEIFRRLGSAASKYSSPNYLKEDLKSRLLKGPVEYNFNIQLGVDLVKTPLENQIVEWTESVSPSITVGKLFLNRQDIDNPDLTRACSMARFTPGNSLPEMRPMGNMGRGRIFSYLASQVGRSAGGSGHLESYTFLQEFIKKTQAK